MRAGRTVAALGLALVAVTVTVTVVIVQATNDTCSRAVHPRPSCTGAPQVSGLNVLDNNVDGVTYRVQTPGTVLDRVHVKGDLLITANDVVVQNSVIDGSVIGEYSDVTYSFRISDSTIGPEHGCNTAPAVGIGEYTATGLHIRNHGDGFRVSGDNVLIEGNYVDLCSNPGDHSDGVQDYTGGTGVVVRDNTFDQRNVADFTAPVFIGQSRDVVVERNLVMGGTHGLRVYNTLGGPMTVRDNQIVDSTWSYGPTDIDCATVTFTGNQIVTIDSDYTVTSIVGEASCSS